MQSLFNSFFSSCILAFLFYEYLIVLDLQAITLYQIDILRSIRLSLSSNMRANNWYIDNVNNNKYIFLSKFYKVQ